MFTRGKLCLRTTWMCIDGRDPIVEKKNATAAEGLTPPLQKQQRLAIRAICAQRAVTSVIAGHLPALLLHRRGT
jgi:hypothetical protein